MRIAFDLSSVLWTSLKVGKDAEGQEVLVGDKKVWVNSAAHGYENAVSLIVAALKEYNLTPIDAIFAQEGAGSKMPRLNIDKNYKASRGEKPDQEYQEFLKLRDKIKQVFRSLGSIFLTQDFAEGDDTLAYLAQHTEDDLIIVTNDNDLSVLNGRNTYGAEVAVRVNGMLGVNKYGDFPFKFVTLYKSMVGDSSDNISGIPGFGPKAWEQVVSRFGVEGLEMLDRLAMKGGFDSLYEDAQQDKLVKKIFEGSADMRRSYKLASIYPNWVDTMENPLKWEPGMVHGKVDDERLRQWAGVRRLVTADKWEAFTAWAENQIKQRPWMALDIETSTPAESDDWLEVLGDPNGVDVIGSKLTGMSLTFGKNMHYTVYIPVDHTSTNNVKSEHLRDWLAGVCKRTGIKLVIHNTNFEGPVLYNEWGAELLDNGYHGFLPNWTDTRFWASYVDENDKLGLKHLSKKWLDYTQVDYNTTTTMRGTPGTISGGKFVGLVQEGEETLEARQYKMAELSAQHVFDYACDDTVTTAGIYNFCRLFTELEHTAHVLESVEIDASYLHAAAFVSGARVDLAKRAELIQEDTETLKSSQAILDTYLISKGWDGSVCPVFTELTPAGIKLAHKIVTGEELETAVRTPSKLLALIQDSRLRLAIESAIGGDFDFLNKLVALNFSGRPELNIGSPKQMQKLMYETMGLPIKVYNAPTDSMRKAGLKVGTPKTDNLAISYALLDCDEELKSVLESLRLIKMVNTRFGLFYEPLPKFVHWKTGRVHSSHNQCATNTRRASSSKPNLQQLSKNEKVEGFSPKVRELYVPHKKDAVIVSLDFSSQELVLMAHWSQDPGMLSCFVGDKLTDMHSMTGVGIHNRMHGTEYSYDEFTSVLKGDATPEQKKLKKSRALGKAVGFGSQYRIAAKKLSLMLYVTEAEAQAMLDAKADAFPVVEEWSLNEMEAVKSTGKVHTVLGAVRHLREQIMSSDRMVASKAPRQTLSYRIQGSAAEQTKLAEGRMWKAGLLSKYDCKYIGPCHDEVIWSVATSDLLQFIPEAHALMTAPYGTMQIPVRSSCSLGPNFGEQIELDGDFSIENINKALGKANQNDS